MTKQEFVAMVDEWHGILIDGRRQEHIVKKTGLLATSVLICACSSTLEEWVTINGISVTGEGANDVSTQCQNAILAKVERENIDATPQEWAETMDVCMLSNGLVRKDDLYEYTPILVEATARRINSDVPVMVDDVTRLDLVENDRRTLRFYHTILDDLVEDINLEQFNHVVPKIVAKNSCSVRPTAVLLENDVVFRYFYFDAEGAKISDFDVDISDCEP
ncbi:hypothetical protein [Enterovibrio norvegicus]|uniref:hypothetical protein n=1 Tax=Enterovibrio norvegicus TaxID=188144 RepID=UPI001F520CA3|nr:hypothetical protein [Enterovibrio norvegicus]